MVESFIEARVTQQGRCVETFHTLKHREGESPEETVAIDWLNEHRPGCKVSFFCDDWDDGYDVIYNGRSIEGDRDRAKALVKSYIRASKEDAGVQVTGA